MNDTTANMFKMMLDERDELNREIAEMRHNRDLRKAEFNKHRNEVLEWNSDLKQELNVIKKELKGFAGEPVCGDPDRTDNVCCVCGGYWIWESREDGSRYCDEHNPDNVKQVALMNTVKLKGRLPLEDNEQVTVEAEMEGSCGTIGCENMGSYNASRRKWLCTKCLEK